MHEIVLDSFNISC